MPPHPTLQSLKRRAELVVDTFNGLEGVTCNPVEGALYAFPQLTMPEGARKAAARQHKQPDFVYCMELLDQTGIVTVPGSGFGQVRAPRQLAAGAGWRQCLPSTFLLGRERCIVHSLCLSNCPLCGAGSSHSCLVGPALCAPQEVGTYHVRTTILPPEADMAAVAEKFSAFHKASGGKGGRCLCAWPAAEPAGLAAMHTGCAVQRCAVVPCHQQCVARLRACPDACTDGEHASLRAPRRAFFFAAAGLHGQV